jgi:hypothetical protein
MRPARRPFVRLVHHRLVTDRQVFNPPFPLLSRGSVEHGRLTAIICHPGNLRAIAYLDDVKDDGSALYKPLLAQTYATVTPDRILHYQGVKDCDGKSIDQLKKRWADTDIRKRPLTRLEDAE